MDKYPLTTSKLMSLCNGSEIFANSVLKSIYSSGGRPFYFKNHTIYPSKNALVQEKRREYFEALESFLSLHVTDSSSPQDIENAEIEFEKDWKIFCEYRDRFNSHLKKIGIDMNDRLAIEAERISYFKNNPPTR